MSHAVTTEAPCHGFFNILFIFKRLHLLNEVLDSGSVGDSGATLWDPLPRFCAPMGSAARNETPLVHTAKRALALNVTRMLIECS